MNSVTTAQGVIPRQAEHGTGGILWTGYARHAKRKPARMDRQRSRFFPVVATPASARDAGIRQPAPDIRIIYANDFDSKTPRWVALKRIVKCHTGHKHRHRIGPGRAANEDRERRKKAVAAKLFKRRRYTAMVRAYWAGERDEHP